MVEMTKKALIQDKNLLEASEVSVIEKALGLLQGALEESNRDKIHDFTQKLNEASENFAAKRMDRSIQQALSGKTINTLEF